VADPEQSGSAAAVRRSLAVAVLFCVPVLALDTSKLKPTGYVNDFAGVVDAGAQAALERYCGDVEKSTGAQMAVVTVNSLDGEPIEDVANRLYREWGIGKKGKDEGVLLLLATRDRKSRLEVGYGLEPILPDAAAGDILREMRPSLREGNYGAALQAGASAIGERIAQAKGATIQRTLPRRAAPEPSSGPGIPVPLVIIGLIVLFWLLSRGGGGGGFLTGMILGNMMGGRRGGGWGGGWGGGGFGGGGGGGWGGFGGGDSGGGGASSNW
jgi:uncharacterized protein